MLIALFGINDGALNLVVNLLVLFLVCVWLALIFWTYRDAKQRMEDPVLIMTAAGASLIPFAGTVVYTILRPPEYLADARERDLEIQAAELRVRQLREGACPNCESPIERSFLRCPSCQVRLKDPCSSCSQPVDPRWSVCPFCETPLRGSRRTGSASESRRPPSSGSSRSPRRPEQRSGSAKRSGPPPSRSAQDGRSPSRGNSSERTKSQPSRSSGSSSKTSSGEGRSSGSSESGERTRPSSKN